MADFTQFLWENRLNGCHSTIQFFKNWIRTEFRFSAHP